MENNVNQYPNLTATENNVNQYPNLEKMSDIQEKSQAIGEFLEWLQNEKKVLFRVKMHYVYYDKNFKDAVMEAGEESAEAIAMRNRHPAKWEYGGERPCHYQTEQLLAEFFGIDLKEVEKEKRAILASLRK